MLTRMTFEAEYAVNLKKCRFDRQNGQNPQKFFWRLEGGENHFCHKASVQHQARQNEPVVHESQKWFCLSEVHFWLWCQNLCWVAESFLSVCLRWFLPSVSLTDGAWLTLSQPEKYQWCACFGLCRQDSVCFAAWFDLWRVSVYVQLSGLKVGQWWNLQIILRARIFYEIFWELITNKWVLMTGYKSNHVI